MKLGLYLKAFKRLEPYDGKLSRTVVCPGKAGMFSRENKILPEEKLELCSLGSSMAGNQDVEAYRQTYRKDKSE